jgi:tetratricopeptide (TPR) repeat protein
MTANWQALIKLNQPLLIVIDYAETRQSGVLAVVKAALQTPTMQPVRILLLARDGGEWWDNLPSQDPDCEAFLSGYATSGPFRLAALYATSSDRQSAFTTALDVFARALNVNAPNIRVQLLGEHFERPLYIQMAALLALYGERPITAEGITRALLNHERRYWKRLLAHFNWAEPERRAEQLLALATLAGGFPISREARKIWDQASRADISAGDFNSLFRELAALYPGTQGLEPLSPDLLGEALVAQAVLRPQSETVLDAVLADSATKDVRKNALTVLARLSPHRLDLHETIVDALVRKSGQSWKDLVEVSAETVSRLPELAEEAFGRLSSVGKGNVAGLLAPVFREESVQFAELSSLVFGYLAEKSRMRFEQRPRDLERLASYASDMTAFAAQVYYNGDRERAVKLGSQGVELYRRLTQKNRDRFESGFAIALDNYASYLSEVGKDDEALTRAKQALELLERLSQKTPERFERYYAISLSNYANRLADLGKDDEALAHTKQALGIRKRLSQKDPERFESEYATSLNNYANRLRDVGKDDEALSHAKQALEIRERLSQKKPDRFEPDYAASLSNYANRLGDVGKDDEALAHAKQALQIDERLSQKKPERFEPDYATSLSNYANRLSEVGKQDEALAYAKRALEISERLSQKKPERFEPDYAASLSNYASHLSRAGKENEALAYAKQALEISERLSQKKPERFEPVYATSLSNYASQLSELGKEDEALAYAKQALEIRERLSQKKPERFEPEYATSLNNYASQLSELGKEDEALAYAKQALEIRERLSQKKPERFEPDYATSLSNYANLLSDVGKDEEALAYANQALEIRERLSEKNAVRFAEELFTTRCTTSFFGWLSGRPQRLDHTDLNQLLTLIRPHQRPLMFIFSEFVAGCYAEPEHNKLEAFRAVVTRWHDLSMAQRNSARSYWLCAAAWWGARFDKDLVVLDWNDEWTHFVKKRNSAIPKWMLEVAIRLGFEWPALVG